MNVYGPYMDKVECWDNFFIMDYIQNGLVVIGGDLNFTLGASYVWGLAAQLNYLSGYFLKKLEEVSLLDIELAKFSPTHRNKRVEKPKFPR
jgi:hypothetical protein